MRAAGVLGVTCLTLFALGGGVASAVHGGSHTLDVSVVGSGTVTDNTGQISCKTANTGTCSAVYPANAAAPVVLTATPSPGFSFALWSGCPAPSGDTCTIDLKLAAYSVTANFASDAPPASADLAVAKTDSADPVFVGSPFEYRLTVANAGPSDATGVTVTDVLPASVTFTAASPSQGSCTHSGGTVTCTLGTLPNLTSATVDIDVVAAVAGTVTNSSSVTSSTNDPTPSNNADTETTILTPAPPPVPSADLMVSKSAPAEGFPGAVYDYVVSVVNRGPDAAGGVTVTDLLPAAGGVIADRVTTTRGTCRVERPSFAFVGGGTVACELGSLEVGGTVTITIPVQMFELGPITNVATVTSSTGDPNGSNNRGEATIGVIPLVPRVEIQSPEDGALFGRPPARLTMSGRIFTSGGFRAFCVSVDRATIPVKCLDSGHTSGTDTSRTFADVPVAALREGRHVLRAWVRDRLGRAASDSATIEIASTATGLDLRAFSMEVSQGIQRNQLPRADGRIYREPGLEPHPGDSYFGVILAESKMTAVRLYATADSTGPATTIRGVRAVLHGFRQDGPRLRALPGSPLLPERGPRDLGREPWPDSRFLPGGAYTFTLPRTWVEGRITLVGEVNPTSLAPAIPECFDCRTDNAFTLAGIPFRRMEGIAINTVSLSYVPEPGAAAVAPSADPSPALDRVRELAPVAAEIVHVTPYLASLDITRSLQRVARDHDFPTIAACLRDPEPEEEENCAEAASRRALAECGRWNEANPRPGKTLCLERGLRGRAYVDGEPGIADPVRPLTSVAHEVVHMLGREHASNACGAEDGDPWFPDGRGFIHGIGLNLRRGSAGAYPAPPYAVLAPDFPDEGQQFYDLMSYCAGNENGWISTDYWDALARDLTPTAARAALRPGLQAVGPTLRVTAVVEPRAEIVHVGPGGTVLTRAEGSTEYRILVRDGAGAVISDTPVQPLEATSHTAPQRVVHADVLAGTAAASVEIVRRGTLLARRQRSAHAPAAQITRPRAGVRLRGRFVDVRWRASDADGDALSERVDYSPDGGRSWRTVATGTAGAAQVPARLLAASRRGRLRVVVHDGFNETGARSGRLVVAGTAPTAHIVSPRRAARVRADVPLMVVGEAYDDRGAAIRPSRLSWRLDGRRVSGGRAASLVGLGPGRHVVTLVARDRLGRTARAKLRVSVDAVAPAFVALRAPKRLSRRAGTLQLRTAATMPATLVVNGLRFRVDRKPRTIAVAVRPGRRVLVVRLRLTASGRSSALTLRIRR